MFWIFKITDPDHFCRRIFRVDFSDGLWRYILLITYLRTFLHVFNFRGDQSSYNNGFPFESVENGNQRAGSSGGWVSICITWLFLSSVKMTMAEKIKHLKLRIFRQDQCPGGSIEACVGVCPGSSTRWPSMFFTSTNKKMDFHKWFLLLLLRVYGACVRGCDSRCPEWSFVLVFCLLPSQQGEIYYETLRCI